jgi:hypothetical protein
MGVAAETAEELCAQLHPAAGRGLYPVQKDPRVALLGAFVRLRSRLLAHSEVLDFPHWSNP